MALKRPARSVKPAEETEVHANRRRLRRTADLRNALAARALVAIGAIIFAPEVIAQAVALVVKLLQAIAAKVP